MVLLYPARHVYFPANAEHTATVILLHERGSNGSELASDLAEARTSAGKTVFAHFLSVRWVFPSARPRWSDQFRKEISEWFDLPSVEDPDQDGQKQLPGLQESVEYIHRILDEEVTKLGGNAARVVLGGIGQGMAVALVALICSPRPLGAFVGAMGWMPFSGKLTTYLEKGETEQAAIKISDASKKTNRLSFGTPVLLGHGEDDQWISVRLGETARDILLRLGFQVLWKTYRGVEGDGHWLKKPEQYDDIVRFLEDKFKQSPSS
ncbi:Alpha/Beta hydrolase fold [Elaphomyces granulatus]